MEIDVAFSAWAKHTENLEKGIKALSPPRPIRKNVGVANTPSALTTQTLIIPQSPASGRMWFIHRVAILGADGHTSVAGAVADIYTGPNEALADATSEIYAGLTLPTIIVEGRHHNPVLHGELVYAIVYGLPAQQQVQFAVGIDEYPVDAMIAMTM
jgi:hypothetical protein